MLVFGELIGRWEGSRGGVLIRRFWAVVAMATGKACEAFWLKISMEKVEVKFVLLKNGEVVSSRPLVPPWDLSSSFEEGVGFGSGSERGRERKSRKRYCWNVALLVDVGVM